MYDYEEGHAFQVHRYTRAGQWGTHVDPPVHFIEGGRTVEQLPVREMILPVVVLDISARVAADSDAVPSLGDLARWENRHGPIPAGAFVALRTDWHRRWPDRAAITKKDADGVSHTPGWSRPVLETLFEFRGVTAISHEQTDTDPGIAASCGFGGFGYPARLCALHE